MGWKYMGVSEGMGGHLTLLSPEAAQGGDKTPPQDPQSLSPYSQPPPQNTLQSTIFTKLCTYLNSFKRYLIFTLLHALFDKGMMMPEIPKESVSWSLTLSDFLSAGVSVPWFEVLCSPNISDWQKPYSKCHDLSGGHWTYTCNIFFVTKTRERDWIVQICIPIFLQGYVTWKGDRTALRLQRMYHYSLMASTQKAHFVSAAGESLSQITGKIDQFVLSVTNMGRKSVSQSDEEGKWLI